MKGVIVKMAELKVPELAESITEGTIAQWLKKEGEYVEKGDFVVELETDKVNVEVIAEQSGVITKLLREEGDTVQVGEAIAEISEGVAPQAEAARAPVQAEAPAPEATPVASASVEAEPAAEEQSKLGETLASPAARRLAREKGIDLNQVQTNDPLGRVRKQDVALAGQTPAPQAVAPAAPVASSIDNKPVERLKMSRRRQTIAKRLVEAQHTAAMLTTFNEVDMTAVMELRNRYKDQFFEQNGVKLGFMSFFTKAVIGALKQSPYLNGEIQGDEILVKKYYDIGVAVSTNEGLVVPVVRDADRLNFAELEAEIANLAKKARENKLSLGDLTGGTFTITNGGVFGSLLSTPILNSPQVGILGMHKVQWRPIAIDKDRMENRPMMYIALSYDHRIVDGKEAVTFLVKVKELLENPEQLLLQG